MAKQGTTKAQLAAGLKMPSGYSVSTPTATKTTVSPKAASAKSTSSNSSVVASFMDGSGFDASGGAHAALPVSTTTLSNQNKISQVPGIINKTNQLAQTGIKTDVNGVPQYANGTMVPEFDSKDATASASGAPDLSKSGVSSGGYFGDVYYAPGAQVPKGQDGKPVKLTSSSPTDDRILSNLNALKGQSDKITASIIDSIHANYASLKSAQEASNKAQEAGVKNALLMGGVTGQGSSAQFAPVSSSGIIAAQINYGLSEIATLTSKENSAIIEAQQANLQNNFQLADKMNAVVDKIRDQKVAAAVKLNDKIQEQNEKLAEEEMQMNKDTAISSLFKSGITDPSSILQHLKEMGLTVSAKEVAETLGAINPNEKAINDIMLEAAKYGATPETLGKIQGAKTIGEAIANAGEFLSADYKRQVEQQRFDNDIKLKELLIDQARLSLDEQKAVDSSGMSNEDLMAYAQQYAATGTIPTGLPKGTFGAVSKVAGALPKPEGTIIDVNTGTAPAKLSAAQKDGVAALYDLTKKVNEAQELFKTFKTGVFAGLWNKLAPTEQNTAYNVLRGEIVDLLSRARSGAALTETEIAQYESKIPSRFVNAFETGPEGTDVLKGLEKSLSEKLDTNLRANGLQIVGYGEAAMKSPDMQRASEFDDTGPFNQGGSVPNNARNSVKPTGMRTDRHNNPTAFTTDIAKIAGLKEGVDYTAGDSFSNGSFKTAKILGDPVATTIKVIDKIGFYTQSGKPRWTYTNSIPQARNWNTLSYDQKKNVIKQMYAHEGGTQLSKYFA